MKSFNNFSKIFALILIVNVVFSCSSDGSDIPENAVTVSFSQNSIILNEDDSVGKEFEIMTDLSVKTLGKVAISFGGDAEYGIDYITQPAAQNGQIEVVFPEASQRYDFKIIPIENNDKNHNVTITATLKNASGGVKIGGKSTLNQTINNIDIIRDIFFTEPSFTTPEDSYLAKYTVRITTDREILTPSQLVVKVETDNAIEGVDYTISEEVINGEITFDIEKNSAGVEFVIEAIDNDIFDGDKTVKFTIISATGGIRANGFNQFMYIIEDDDEPAPMNFREESSQGVEAIPENYYNITAYSDFQTPFAGTLEVKITTDAIYGEHYKTNPEAVNGIATLQVDEGTSDVTIQVVGINNNSKDPDRVIELELVKATGGVVIGNGIKKHTITITDDD